MTQNSPHAAAQTVGHFSYNAYFYQLRSSKTPANAHEMKICFCAVYWYELKIS